MAMDLFQEFGWVGLLGWASIYLLPPVGSFLARIIEDTEIEIVMKKPTGKRHGKDE